MRPITAALLMRCHALAGHRCPEQPLPVDAAVSLSGERADGELALRWAIAPRQLILARSFPGEPRR